MKAINGVLFSAICLVAALSWAAQGIFGTWNGPTINMGTVKVITKMKFEKTRVTAKSICSINGGQPAVVEVSAPALITSNSVTIQQAASKQVNHNGLNCSASLAV